MSSEEVELLSDSKYRQFIAAVEKALRSFESTSEWADLISALGKLNKVLQSYSKFTIIPRKLMIGKRLSQCMHPALPSGVHLKALETYTLIFERIGQKRFAQDLFIYSAGLFPLMSYSAMSVKPILMQLYEDHFLPLGLALVPSLPGLLLALLPGIEEGSDYIQRTISLLESFSSCTDKDVFFDALWQAMVTTPTARLPATIFLLSQLDRHLSLEEQKHLFGKNYSFMVQGICLTLNDQLALVQRNVLDFSVQLLPLNSTFLSQHDLSTIMCAALGVLLRRDMSLNRRLHQWMLGPNGDAAASGGDTEENTTQYFETHSKPLVVEGLRSLFRHHVGTTMEALKSGTKLEILKPYRILLNLLDKPEIGSAILEEILVDVFQNLSDNDKFFRHCDKSNAGRRPGSATLDRTSKGSKKEDALKEGAMEELVKTANLLFNTFEPYFMWQYIAKVLAQCNVDNIHCCNDGTSVETVSGLPPKRNGLQIIDIIRLTDFILDIVALEASVETESKHWPELLARIIQELTKGCEYLSLDELEEGIHLCSKLLSKVTPSTNVVLDTDMTGTSHHHHPDPTVFGSIEDSLDATATGLGTGDARSGSSESVDSLGSQTSSETDDEDTELAELEQDGDKRKQDGDKAGTTGKEGDAEKETKVDGKEKAGDGKRRKTTEREKSCPEKSCGVERKKERRKNKVGRREGAGDEGAQVMDRPRGGENITSFARDAKEESVDVGQSALIRDSIKDYEKFILEFFRYKILNSEKWNACVDAEQECTVLGETGWPGAKIVGGGSSSGCTSDKAKTYSATCKLLVELSCFPMHSKGSETDGHVISKTDKLPSWLKCLITCCCEEVDDFDIQSTSVATLLDLINLTLSVSPDNQGGRAGGTVIPILTYEEVMIIEKSDIYQVIANNLWSILGCPATIHHRKAVELLIQLHNLTPSPHLCENVIGSSMVSDCKESRLEALKRFANLWHIAKSILAQSVGRTARGLRTFDRSLFVMLDGLESDEPEIRSLTKMWLSHSLEQGDIGRILEPLLLLLLHPSTARVSYYYKQKRGKKVSVSGKSGKRRKSVEEGCDESNDANATATATNRSPDMHKLHYCGKCDYQRILYAFRTLSSILCVVPRQFVCAAAATSIGSSSGPYEERIRELLIRHKRSLLGSGFYGPLFGGNSAVATDTSASMKLAIKPNTSKYLEILITIALYFIRSHYPPTAKMEADFIEGNIKTQVVSLECLSNLTWELVKLVRESGHGFGNFITDLLSRCKVQKAIAHCLAATTKVGDALQAQRLSESRGVSQQVTEETVDEMILQSKLLEVVESLIVLEHVLVSCFEALTPDHLGNTDFEIIMKGDEVNAPPQTADNAKSLRFVQGKSLSSQEMLLNMVLCSLEPKRGFDMSSRWTGFVIECLPYFGANLRKWVVPVVLQMCHNIDDVTSLFKNRETGNEKCLVPIHKQLPPDHLLAVLAGLTSICHFCLLEAVSSPVLVMQARGAGAGIVPGQSADAHHKNVRSTQIFANLLHAFSSNSKTSDSPSNVENPTPLLEAREGLLSVLPRVIATLLALWGTWNLEEPLCTLPSSMALLGTAKALRQSILQLLTPIAMTHTIVFLAAITDVWNKNRVTDKEIDLKPNGYLAISDEQLRIISLVLDIKALSLEVVIDTVRQILRQELSNRDKGFEASLLHFFHEFLQRSTVAHMTQAKAAFLTLLKEGLQLNLPPPAVFWLLVNLHSYCVKTPNKDDRKSRKETQDISQRLIEACTQVAGMSLGSSAWFSGKLSVIAVPDASGAEQGGTAPEEDATKVEVKPESQKKATTNSSNGNASKHSAQALLVLADVLASLLDMVFGREEKERVVNFLINVMGNVTPYLRNHSYANVRSFRACSSLVASLSGYQYTRKAWRKDMFDLFFETVFFQMDKECINNWSTIIDNLFAQDPSSFRELMARATVTSSPAISFFANHEQEMQQRALMVKRLSFAVFSSEPDQYKSFLPEMQERLAECLRMPQVPVLHEQVFLFFRVLLVRMTDNMTSIWPMIISEMIHVFLLMESDLLQTDTPSRDQQMFYSETVLGASGYVNYSPEKWLGLYLAVCKLLDMALCLPPEQLPQFQMYRWAFEGSHEAPQGETTLGSVFTPYVSRITKLLAKRKNVYVTDKSLECHAGKPLLTVYQLESVDELLPFLRLLATDSRLIHDMRNSGEKQKTRKLKSNASRSLIERLIERDFLDPLIE